MKKLIFLLPLFTLACTTNPTGSGPATPVPPAKDPGLTSTEVPANPQ